MITSATKEREVKLYEFNGKETLFILAPDSNIKQWDLVLNDNCVAKVINYQGRFVELDFGWGTTQIKPTRDCIKLIRYKDI